MFLSILEIAIGLAVIVLARMYRFDEKFYDLREAYLKFVNANFKNHGKLLKNIDERSQERFHFLRRFDRKLGRLMLCIFYLLGFGMTLLGVRIIITSRYELLDIFFVLTIPAIIPLYLFAGKLKHKADKQEHQE